MALAERRRRGQRQDLNWRWSCQCGGCSVHGELRILVRADQCAGSKIDLQESAHYRVNTVSEGPSSNDDDVDVVERLGQNRDQERVGNVLLQDHDWNTNVNDPTAEPETLHGGANHQAPLGLRVVTSTRFWPALTSSAVSSETSPIVESAAPTDHRAVRMYRASVDAPAADNPRKGAVHKVH